MPTLTKDDVLHIAKLARLTLSPEEVTRYTTELTKIFAYIDLLQTVDTTDVEATAQVTGLTHALRDDVVTAQITDPDALLATSPLPIVDHQIQTSSAHG